MANLVSNTIVSPQDWATKLQEELDQPTKWKDICNVEYTNTKVLHNPYFTDPTVASITRGSPYGFEAIVQTDENTVIDTGKIVPQAIDRADLAQSFDYSKQMYLAQRHGVLLN